MLQMILVWAQKEVKRMADSIYHLGKYMHHYKKNVSRNTKGASVKTFEGGEECTGGHRRK